LRPWRYPMCLSLRASFSTTWDTQIVVDTWQGKQIQNVLYILYFVFEKKT
jgi:hypothetical protein